MGQCDTSSFLKRLLNSFFIWLFRLIGLLCLAWGGLALYYSELPYPWLRYTLIGVYLLIALSGMWSIGKLRRGWPFLAVWGLALVAILAHWSTIEPSHDRVWRADVARMPRAYVDGDKVLITNFRNFEYRSLEDFTPRYEDREVDLSHLVSVDFYISYWMPGPVAHTFVSFNFDNASPVNISIEARFEAHENFDPIASLFKQFELIYVVGDEFDIVRVRTNFRKEEVFRYPIRISPEATRKLFLVYLERINELAEQPEFYHLLSNNCTVNIVRYANRSGRVGRLDLRHILNGLSDRYLYRVGIVDTTLPFAELRRQARINDLAITANNAFEFYNVIRERLPSFGLNHFLRPVASKNMK